MVLLQMIPSQLKFSMEGATPSFADNEGQIVEAGSQVRLRIKGIRSELNQMYAIGSIREDYLGYDEAAHLTKLCWILTSDQSSHAVVRIFTISRQHPVLSLVLSSDLSHFFLLCL